jgi:glycosyltransferase involved in cell wall biosynthesis
VLHGRDIVVVSNVDWEPLWQGQQELATRLARAGNRVVFIENMGVRSPRPRDIRRVVARLLGWARAVRSGGLREVRPSLYVASPLTLGPFGSRMRRAINQRLLLPLILQSLRGLGVQDPVLVTYLPTDSAGALVEALRTPASVTVYMCIADWEELAPDVADVRRSERLAVETSELVFAQEPELAELCRRWSRDVRVLGPGVNLEAFELGSVPAAVPGGPVIGYVGALHRHLDLGLVAAVARARPDWTWVFVGPVLRSVRELEALANIHIIGARPHPELASYIAAFDVCVVPYLKTAYTETVVPTKVREYLAMGKPVVSTDLPSMRRLASEPGGPIAVAPRPEAFLEEISALLAAPPEPALTAQRRRLAGMSDWGRQAEAVSGIIESARHRNGNASGAVLTHRRAPARPAARVSPEA